MKFGKTLRVLFASVLPFAAFAETTAGGSGDAGMIALAAAFCMGIAAIGGAMAQGKAASTALDGIARNPQAQNKIFTPMIIGLALIESLVIYALVISFQLVGKF